MGLACVPGLWSSPAGDTYNVCPESDPGAEMSAARAGEHRISNPAGKNQRVEIFRFI